MSVDKSVPGTLLPKEPVKPRDPSHVIPGRPLIGYANKEGDGKDRPLYATGPAEEKLVQVGVLRGNSKDRPIYQPASVAANSKIPKIIK